MSIVELNKYLNLSDVFGAIEAESYCIIKLPMTFPSYAEGSDLDIFCYDLKRVSSLILGEVQKNISKIMYVKVTDRGSQVYIDIMDGEKIHFRFDLYSSLPLYENVNIKSAFFSSTIEHAKVKIIADVKVKVPCDIDEAILRYVEYQECYAQRPDKIKHVKYLEEKIDKQCIDVNEMFDKLHYYTSLPTAVDERKVSSVESIRYLEHLYANLKKLVKYINANGLVQTFTKLKSKFLK